MPNSNYTDSEFQRETTPEEEQRTLDTSRPSNTRVTVRIPRDVGVSRNRMMGSDEDAKEYDQLRQIFYRILMSGMVMGSVVFLLLIYWVLYFGGGFNWNDPAGSVNIHIVVMVFFMLYLHGHASIIYRILPAVPKFQVKLIHAGMHLTVCIGISIGLAAAVQSHNLKNAAHFYSLHSWLGITTIVLYYLQFLGGFLTFLVPITPMSFRIMVLPFHRFTGSSVFSLASGATVTGVMLKAVSSLNNLYPSLPPAGMVLNFAGFIAICFSIAIGNLLTDYRFRRRPRPGSDGELQERLLSSGGVAGGATDTDQSDQAE